MRQALFESPGGRLRSALGCMLLACIAAGVALCGQAHAASKTDPRRKQLEERHRLCVQACPKPVFRQGEEDAVWRENTKAEARYDHCVHQCDQAYLKEKKR